MISVLTPEEYRYKAAVRMLERPDLQARVEEIATLYRWVWYHTYDSRRSPAGFPDLVLVKPPRLLFVELKRQKEKPTVKQELWLATLSRVPSVEVYVWKPLDYLDGSIAKTLSRLG